MSYFPESLMPSRIKQEAEDVNGNQFILSGSDHDRLDEEIRAIEKILGVRGSDVPCTVVSMLRAIRDQLENIRDNYVQTTSGIVACSGFSGAYPSSGFSSLMGFSGFSGTGGFSTPIDGMIRFPPDWTITALIDSIPDASTTDDAVLDPIPSLQIANFSGFSGETGGYVTVINDVAFSGFSAFNGYAQYASLGSSGQDVRALA